MDRWRCRPEPSPLKEVKSYCYSYPVAVVPYVRTHTRRTATGTPVTGTAVWLRVFIYLPSRNVKCALINRVET